MMKKYFFFLFIGAAFNASAQTNVTNGSNEKMDFEKYNPPSTLVVPEHKLAKAKFPFIDVHNHQFNMPDMDLGTLISDMDKLNMKVMVNLSGQSGERIKRSVTNIKQNFPKRFIVFANVDFKRVGEESWGEKAAQQLEEDVKKWCEWFKDL